MSIVQKIFSNTAWQVLGKIIIAALGIISIKYITNYLDASEYGEYTTIYDFTAMFAIVADFGLFTIAVREMAHNSEKSFIQKIVGNVLSIRAILAVLFLGLGIGIAMLIPSYKESYIPIGVIIVSVATLITLIAGTMSSVLQYYLKMQWASVALIIGKTATVLYILATIFWLFPDNPAGGFFHLQIAWIIGGIFALAVTYIACSRVIPITFQLDFSFCKTVIIKALPYGLALVLGTIYFRMGTFTMSLLRDSDSTGFFKEQIGFYGVALRFIEILQIVPHYFMNSVLPILTLRLKDGVGHASVIIKNSANALFAFAFPVLVGGYILSWPITAAVSSPTFLTHKNAVGDIILGSDAALEILLIGILFIYLHVALSYTLVAMGRQIELLRINFIAVIINVVLNIILVPQYGFIGAAVSVVITEFFILAVLINRVHTKITDIWDLPFLAKTIFSGACMGIILWFAAQPLNQLLHSNSLFLLIPLGALTYGICMLLTRAVSRDMLKTIRGATAKESSYAPSNEGTLS